MSMSSVNNTMISQTDNAGIHLKLVMVSCAICINSSACCENDTWLYEKKDGVDSNVTLSEDVVAIVAHLIRHYSNNDHSVSGVKTRYILTGTLIFCFCPRT